MTPVVTLPSPTPRLAVNIDGPVATLAIANPAKRNAFDLEMWQALPALIAAIEAHPGIRVLVLRGEGSNAFASGADISEFETVRADAAGGRRYEAANETAFEALSACKLPTVAMIRQFCLGGGFGLAAACDLRLASDGTRFGIPAGRLGVGYPPGAIATLVAAIGAANVKELIFSGQQFDAERLKQMGFLNLIMPDELLEAETIALANAIAANAPLSLRAAKAAINAAAGLPGGSSREALQKLADACFDSQDYAEGRAAFLAKRTPNFKGI
ncbi:MAG: enoyl-CoA hydratase [Bosea sp. (in: a-proteobacteria)]